MKRSITGWIRAAALAGLPVAIWGGLPGVSAGGEAEDLLASARQAVADGDRLGAWKAIDLVRSNYPAAESPALAVLRSLDAICTADQKVGRISVATWPAGKKAAVSLTFDDALASGHRKAAPDLERRRWRGTYYLTNFNLKHQDKAPWKALALRGHEIGCHTINHPEGLPATSPSTIQSELNCGQFLTPSVTDGPILTFAYPMSNAGAQAGSLRRAVRRRYMAARSGGAGDGRLVEKATPDETDILVSFTILEDTVPSASERELIRAVGSRGWLIFIFHAVIERDGWEPISEMNWQAYLANIDARKDDVWIAPLAEVAGYVQARRTAWTASERDGMDRLKVSVWSELDRSPPDLLLPVTVRVPDSWKEVTISTDDDYHTVRGGEVTFDLKPDGREIILQRFERAAGGLP